MSREVTVWAGAAVWLATVAAGFWLWERYDTTPGRTGETTAAASEPPGRWRLTLFGHPHCPCTRASLRELAEISRAAPDVRVRIVFVRSVGAGDGWERGELWDAACRIFGAEVAADAGGAEAGRFGAETSGMAVLTDPAGREVFRGGLTTARGRAGESAGRRAVLAWVGSGGGDSAAPVFGCPLHSPGE